MTATPLPPDGPYEVNRGTGRAIVEAIMAIACYTLNGDIGTHVGVAESVDEARRWLNGADDVQLIKVHQNA